MEEFFLRTLAGGDELNVVHHEHVHGAEAIAETAHAIEAQRGNHFIREFLGAHVCKPQRWISLLERVADGLHQVRLAEPHSTIKEKWVIGLGGLVGNSLSGS